MISVIIPTHKRKDLLLYELDCIYKQKNADYEIIVINDIEEPDDTDIIKTLYPDIVYIKDKRIQGPSNKHKEGFKIAHGEYLYMPDDDDYLTDEYFFSKAIDLLNKDSSLSFVSGNVVRRYEDENRTMQREDYSKINIIGKIEGKKYFQKFQCGYKKPISTVSTIYRKSALDLKMIEMSDSSMYLYALLKGNAYIMDEFVAVYRVKAGSLTSTASCDFIFNVLKQKEWLFRHSIGIIPEPKTFWYFHYRKTYNFIGRKDGIRKEKMDLLKWGIKHNGGSLRLIFFLFHEYIKVFIKL